MARIINVPTEIPDVNLAAEAALKDTHNPFAQFDEKRGFPLARLRLVNLLLKWAHDPSALNLKKLVAMIHKDTYGASDTASREALAYWAGRLCKPLDEKLWQAMR